MSQLSEKRNVEEKFHHNPLFNVSCELRFNTVLSIKDKVVSFQDLVRQKYPIFSTLYPVGTIGIDPPPFEMNTWEFRNEEETNNIKLKVNSIVFITNAYESFELFEQNTIEVFDKIQELIPDLDIVRIGLRYQNRIEVGDDPLEDYVKYFNGRVNESSIEAENPLLFVMRYQYEVDEVRISCFNQFQLNNNTKKYEYVIDIDSFMLKSINQSDVQSILKRIHEKAILEFHNNIKDKYIEELRKEESKL